MGLWDKIKKGASWVGDKLDRAVEWTAEKVVNGVEWVEEKATNLYNNISNTLNEWTSKKTAKTVDGWGGSGNGGGPGNGGGYEQEPKPYRPKRNSESAIIAETNRRVAVIDSYQEDAKVKAEELEGIARRAYLQTYEDMIETLSQIMDVRTIRNFVSRKSDGFKNQMRDEVNSNISLANHELTDLLDNRSLRGDAYDRSIQSYADKVFNKAKNNLLATLKRAVDETNNYIKTNAGKFLQDQEEILKSLKDNMANLSKEGETGEREFEKVSGEYATLLFVKYLAEKEID